MRIVCALVKSSISSCLLALRAALLICCGASAAFAQTSPGTPGESAGSGASKAMQRDLKFDAETAKRYASFERSAIEIGARLERTLGPGYAGSWIELGRDGSFKLVASAIDAATAGKIRALGIEARPARFALSQLVRNKNLVDRIARHRGIDARIYKWYVDVVSNDIVVAIDPNASQAAIEMLAASGIDTAMIRLVTTESRPQVLDNYNLMILFGGDKYYLHSGGYCSVGFPATMNGMRGFVTAGHCAGVGQTGFFVRRGFVVNFGSFMVSSYPTNDFAWAPIPGHLIDYPIVHAGGGTLNVVGSQSAPIGAAVCKSGVRTGYTCGQIVANHVTVNYGAGLVYGLTQMDACAGRGDSGGAVITPAGQAQGTVSGGALQAGTDTNCNLAQPTTYFQPLPPMLNQFGIVLRTGL